MPDSQKNEINDWEIFINEDKPEYGLYEIQWQTPKLSINLIAQDLSFAQRTIDFIHETQNHPKYRDEPLGNGRYRSLVTELDISEYFVNTSIIIGKDGEFDSKYYLRIRSGRLWLRPDISDFEIDRFVEILHKIVGDWWVQK